MNISFKDTIKILMMMMMMMITVYVIVVKAGHHFIKQNSSITVYVYNREHFDGYSGVIAENIKSID